jgi:dihydroneopterin aldolase
METKKGQKISVHEAIKLHNRLKKALQKDPDNECLQYCFHALSIDLSSLADRIREEKKILRV